MLYDYLWMIKGSQSHLLCPVMFGFCVEEFEGSTPCLGQSSQHVPIGCRAETTKKQETHTFKMSVIKKNLSVQSMVATTMLYMKNVKIMCFSLDFRLF